MDKKFEKPELIIVLFSHDDIITDSIGGGYGQPGDDGSDTYGD